MWQFLEIRYVHAGHRLLSVDVLGNVMDGRNVIFVKNVLVACGRRFVVRDNMASWSRLVYSDSRSWCGSDSPKNCGA